MSEWAAKRFWNETSIVESDDGFAVVLDGRQVKTPAKSPLLMPTRGYAEAVASEWEAQQETIDPRTMPFTRTANAAIDKVRTQRHEVIDILADYGGSDLTCYRADSPESLVERQVAAWNPLIDWATEAFGGRLVPTTGVMFAPQDDEALASLKVPVTQMSDFELAAFHDLVGLSGSLLIALAATRGFAPLEELWLRSRVDELWQAEQWGADEEAAEVVETKRQEFLHAGRVWNLVTARN